MEIKKNKVIHYLKWFLALVCGLICDWLRIAGIVCGVSEIVVTGLMIIVMIICFDVYRKEDKNILKFAYIAMSSVTSTYFSIECIFLIAFEVITTNRKNL